MCSVKFPECSVMHDKICSDCMQCPVCIMLHSGYMALCKKCNAVCSAYLTACTVPLCVMLHTVLSTEQWSAVGTVPCIIQFIKVMYFISTLQVPVTLPSVFSKTDSVCLKEDTQNCVFNNTCPRACISQYNPMGVYWLVQALGQVLCNTHS